jgi:hypothetical protein
MKGKIVSIKANGEKSVVELTKPITLETIKEAVGGGYIELVPGFGSIQWEGKEWHDCVAFCDEEGKLHNQPFNPYATLLWDASLRKQGHSLTDGKGNYHDILVGDIAVIFGDAELMRTV